MKNKICFTLILCLFITLFSGSFVFASELEWYAAFEKTAEKTYMLTYSVKNLGEQDIAAGTFEITYDDSSLIFVSASMCDETRTGDLIANPANGALYLVYLDSAGGNNPITKDGKVFQIIFTSEKDLSENTLQFNARVDGLGNSKAEELTTQTAELSVTLNAGVTAEEEDSPKKSNVMTWILSGAAVLVLTGVAVILLLNLRKKQKAAPADEPTQPQEEEPAAATE